MATTPRKCQESERRMCSHFVPFLEKVSHELYTKCHGQQCNVELRCDHCNDWSIEQWEKVESPIDNLVKQHERKAMSKLSFSYFPGFSSMHAIPLFISKLLRRPGRVVIIYLHHVLMTRL